LATWRRLDMVEIAVEVAVDMPFWNADEMVVRRSMVGLVMRVTQDR